MKCGQRNACLHYVRHGQEDVSGGSSNRDGLSDRRAGSPLPRRDGLIRPVCILALGGVDPLPAGEAVESDGAPVAPGWRLHLHDQAVAYGAFTAQGQGTAKTCLDRPGLSIQTLVEAVPLLHCRLPAHVDGLQQVVEGETAPHVGCDKREGDHGHGVHEAGAHEIEVDVFAEIDALGAPALAVVDKRGPGQEQQCDNAVGNEEPHHRHGRVVGIDQERDAGHKDAPPDVAVPKDRPDTQVGEPPDEKADFEDEDDVVVAGLPVNGGFDPFQPALKKEIGAGLQDGDAPLNEGLDTLFILHEKGHQKEHPRQTGGKAVGKHEEAVKAAEGDQGAHGQRAQYDCNQHAHAHGAGPAGIAERERQDDIDESEQQQRDQPSLTEIGYRGLGLLVRFHMGVHQRSVCLLRGGGDEL